MLSFSLPAVRAKRFVLLFNRETESWGCLVPGRRIPSKSEPEPAIESRTPVLGKHWLLKEHDFSCVLSKGRQLLIFCIVEHSFAPDSRYRLSGCQGDVSAGVQRGHRVCQCCE